MAFILPIEEPWTSQPQVAAGIDWSNQIAKKICGGFISCGGTYPPKTLPWLVEDPTRSANSPYTDLLPKPSVWGLSAMWSDDGGSTRVIGYKTGSPNARNFTFLARVKVNTTPSSPGVICRTDTTATGAAGTTIPLWQNTAQFDMRINGTDYTQAGTWNNGLWYDVAIVGTSSACILYVDGNSIISGAAAAAGTIQPWCSVGDLSGGGVIAGGVEFGYLIWCSEALSVGEIASFYRNPWQIFAP